MAQRRWEESSEAPISNRRKWNLTLKPRFELGVFAEGLATCPDNPILHDVFYLQAPAAIAVSRSILMAGAWMVLQSRGKWSIPVHSR